MQIKQNQPTTKKSDSDGDVEIKTSKTISNNLKVVKELESTIWVDLKKGNKIALGKLYDIYIDSLFAFGIQNSQDRSFVMDCIHDLFLDLYKYRSTIKITDNSKNYLFKSLKRKINKRYLRKTSPKSEEFIIYKNKIFKKKQNNIINIKIYKIIKLKNRPSISPLNISAPKAPHSHNSFPVELSFIFIPSLIQKIKIIKFIYSINNKKRINIKTTRRLNLHSKPICNLSCLRVSGNCY